LTPGRQRAYLLHLSKPKQSKTRAARVDWRTQQILEGKGLNGEDTGRRSARPRSGAQTGRGVNTMAGKSTRKAAKKKTAKGAQVVPLLSGGNPQIPKGEGDAPVQAYIAAMPGWKRDVGRRLDALIESAVPGVHKAVKWNSPFYGVEGQGWFLGVHCLTKYVKVAFFRGASLRPVPPVSSKDKETRYFHVHEDDQLDEELFASWVRQAAALPGWAP